MFLLTSPISTRDVLLVFPVFNPRTSTARRWNSISSWHPRGSPSCLISAIRGLLPHGPYLSSFRFSDRSPCLCLPNRSSLPDPLLRPHRSAPNSASSLLPPPISPTSRTFITYIRILLYTSTRFLSPLLFDSSIPMASYIHPPTESPAANYMWLLLVVRLVLTIPSLLGFLLLLPLWLDRFIWVPVSYLFHQWRKYNTLALVVSLHFHQSMIHTCEMEIYSRDSPTFFHFEGSCFQR